GLRRRTRFDFYTAITGLELTPEEWCKPKALRILQLQRAMLLLAGPDLKWNPKIHDANPNRFYEPLSKGPYEGKAPQETKMEKDKKQYYQEAGWDENGIPRSETLRRLGLQDVDKTLDKLRN
ncbi:MAG: aldehyde ferredoxin oxidoreductase C-terminal domain-containing protein, partial [Candidatus Bathyarchaeota archaeon]|nr:aldehyde ferredoxin oxidoreductase C-terminal domain-containing protein [Candidatus Bathyarchaeota archaeon]